MKLSTSKSEYVFDILVEKRADNTQWFLENQHADQEDIDFVDAEQKAINWAIDLIIAFNRASEANKE